MKKGSKCTKEQRKHMSDGQKGNTHRKGTRKYKVEPKVCPICGTIFEKPPTITYKTWERRFGCCGKCSCIYNGLKKRKKIKVKKH